MKRIPAQLPPHTDAVEWVSDLLNDQVQVLDEDGAVQLNGNWFAYLPDYTEELLEELYELGMEAGFAEAAKTVREDLQALLEVLGDPVHPPPDT